MRYFGLMRGFMSAAAVGAAFLFSPGIAAACTEQSFVPAHLSCGGNSTTGQADFVGNCSYVPLQVVNVQVACPPPPRQASGGGGGGGGSEANGSGDGSRGNHP